MMMRKLFIACLAVLALLYAPVFPVRAAETDNPRLLLSSYTINDGSAEIVTPGIFTLHYTLHNASTVRLVNTVLSYEQRNNFIVPVHGKPNVEYIGAINAERDYNGSFALYIPDNAPSGLCRLDFVFSYNVGDPANHANPSQTSYIYLRILNNPGLNIKQAELSNEVTGAGRRYLFIEYENPGTSDLKNLLLTISGNIDEQQKTQSLPILKAGRSNSIEYPIQFIDAGVQPIDIAISYDDDTGYLQQTQKISLQAHITENEITEISPPGTLPPQGFLTSLLSSFMKNIKNPAFLAILLIITITIAIIVINVMRMRKQAIRKRWYYKNGSQKNGNK